MAVRGPSLSSHRLISLHPCDRRPGRISQYPYPRSVGVRRVRLQDDRDLPRGQPHEVAGWIDADELHESADEMRVESRAVVLLENRENPIGRKSGLIDPLRSHRIVHVSDPAEHGPQIQCRTGGAEGIPSAVQPQVVLERDHRVPAWGSRVSALGLRPRQQDGDA